MDIKKGDIVALVETRVTQFVFGSGRPAETRQTIRLVRVESASRDGKVKKFRAYPGSPVYPFDSRYGSNRILAIGGEPQAKARKLFDGASYFVEFDSQDAAKSAIMAAA